MSADLMRALAIAGSILIGVVIIVVIVSYAAVNRGDAEMAADSKQHGEGH